jgi:hypothetical protein
MSEAGFEDLSKRIKATERLPFLAEREGGIKVKD